MTIRHARATDAPRLLPLVQALNTHEGISWQPAPLAAALDRLLSDPAIGRVLVAESADTPDHFDGYAIATFGFDLEFAGRDAFLTELYVAEGARGRGVGRALLRGIQEELRAADVRAVHLMVRPGNAEAQALYHGEGFREVPRQILTKRLDAGG